jgi:hypothetical protein
MRMAQLGVQDGRWPAPQDNSSRCGRQAQLPRSPSGTINDSPTAPAQNLAADCQDSINGFMHSTFMYATTACVAIAAQIRSGGQPIVDGWF